MPDQDDNEREEISRRAYDRYVQRGQEEGRDQEDWLEAERDVRGRAGTSDETGPTATPTGTGPGGDTKTRGTAVSGGPTESGR